MKRLLLTLVTLIASNCFGSIINGDFSNNLSGWSTDTDGLPGAPTDFQVINESAYIFADYYKDPGDLSSYPLNNVFFANTLYQELSVTDSDSSKYTLSFEWEFDGEANISNDSNEYFFIGINNGSGKYLNADATPGFIIDPTYTYGAGGFSTEIDFSGFNSTSLYLDFQLGVGVDKNSYMNDGLGSYLKIDNVSLTNAYPVTAPDTLSLGAILFITIMLLRIRREK